MHYTSRTANIKKGDIIRSVIFPQCQFTAEQYHLFDICCFAVVYKLLFCTLILTVLLATFAQWLTSITLVRLSLC